MRIEWIERAAMWSAVAAVACFLVVVALQAFLLYAKLNGM